MELRTQTPNKHIIIDDCDKDKFKNKRIYFNRCQNDYSVDVGGKRKSVSVFLFDTNFKVQLVRLGARNDFRRSQNEIVSIAEKRRFNSQQDKLKGVVTTKNTKYIKWWYNGKDYRIKDNYLTDEERAGLYNFGCDYFGFDGFRNNVPDFKPFSYHLEKLRDIKEKMDV